MLLIESMTNILKIVKFFITLTGFNISVPKVKNSTKVKDSAWYSNNTIFINKKHNQEHLKLDEMVAHEFFHHVQNKMHIKQKENTIESNAMFFAGAYMNRKYRGKELQRHIVNYLKQKEHIPKGGNRSALSVFKHNKYNVSKTVIDFLS